MFTLVDTRHGYRQADRYDGTPGHPAGATPIAPAARLQLAPKARGQLTPVTCALSYTELAVISGAAPGTTSGNHRAHSSRHLRASPGMVLAVQMHEPAREAGRDPCRIPPYKRGVRRFKSYCAHQIYAGRRIASEQDQRAKVPVRAKQRAKRVSSRRG